MESLTIARLVIQAFIIQSFSNLTDGTRFRKAFTQQLVRKRKLNRSNNTSHRRPRVSLKRLFPKTQFTLGSIPQHEPLKLIRVLKCLGKTSPLSQKNIVEKQDKEPKDSDEHQEILCKLQKISSCQH
ncbi:hypothetical protein KC19_6G170900 [Ceratodon purpureus]|uniref:Uncharacterized protein n=1 Tax=Ceratodon purpureus TaxID=3225 RepID=A0A8T0HFK4_CERPU|nr:hypothetical protein KC19_6G170900 [Ceratodon purpureus]